MEKELVARLSAIGMTRKDLAQSLGVSLSSIYHWRELPKYVEAYLDARYREHGLDMSSVSDGVVAIGEAVQLSGESAGSFAGMGQVGEAVQPAGADRSDPAADGNRIEPEPVGGRRRG